MAGGEPSVARPLSIKNVYFVSTQFVFISSHRAGSGPTNFVPPAPAPSIERPRDSGLTLGRARARSAPGSGKIGWGRRDGTGSGKNRWDGAEQPAGRGGAGEAGAARGQIPAAWRRRVCAPSGARRRSEVRVWSGGLGQFFARATPNKRQIDLWSRVVPPPGTRGSLVPGRGTTRY